MKRSRLLPLSFSLLATAACVPGDESSTTALDGMQTGWVLGPDGDYMEVQYELIDGTAVLDGDIILTDVKDSKPPRFQRAAALKNGNWGSAIVPYTIGAGFSATQIAEIQAAITEWNTHTPYWWTPRQSFNKDYVEFTASDRCNSAIGMQGGKQDILLGTGCGTDETIHEMGHAVGFYHEQARQDRDNFINIDFDNVKADKAHNFNKYLASKGEDWGPYELESIMHYPAMITDADFVKDTTINTITRKDGSTYVTSQVLTGLDRANAFRKADKSDSLKDKWLANMDKLGYAVDKPLGMTNGDAGRYLPTQNGRVYVMDLDINNPHYVVGAIGGLYVAIGAESMIGEPITDETATPDGVGRYNHFKWGSIYWTPSTGAHVISGGIRDKWASMGWERSFLGYPTSSELDAGDGIGRVNSFENGAIYWSPATGSNAMSPAIVSKWQSMGMGAGTLGYPVSDVRSISDGYGETQNFENGAIYSSPDHGTHWLSGPILEKYRWMLAEKSHMGYPTSDIGFGPNGAATVHFQGGRIELKANGEVVVVKPNVFIGPESPIPGVPLCVFLLEGC